MLSVSGAASLVVRSGGGEELRLRIEGGKIDLDVRSLSLVYRLNRILNLSISERMELARKVAETLDKFGLRMNVLFKGEEILKVGRGASSRFGKMEFKLSGILKAIPKILKV